MMNFCTLEVEFKNIGMKKKLSNCYWPEFTRYCGCCDLSTGIYIRSLITLIITTISLIINSAILDYLFSIGTIIYSANLTKIDDYILTSRDEPERDLATLQLIYKSLLVYYIMWITFKALYVITVVCTAYAIYRKKTWMLKFLLFISVPNWILDFFISFIGTTMLTEGLKVTLLICNLSEGYNILAVNSEYKRMRGKSRLAVEDIESESRSDQTYANNYINQQHEPYQSEYTQHHCRSCTCFEHTWNRNTSETGSGDVITAEPTTSAVGERPNYTGPTFSNANNDISQGDIRTDPTGPNGDITSRMDTGDIQNRPNTIELNIKAKQDISELPVIYDEEQLNIGSSPVIEDRHINSND